MIALKGMFGINGLEESEYAISANAILGIRDSGKTYTATEASEELFEAVIPFVWLDPIGVAHNMRIPGKGRGYPIVVAGGKFGDLPLTRENVDSILRAALKAGVSIVFDLFSVELSKSDWRYIVRKVCEILLHENGDYGLRHVFVEEAAEFVPQQPRDFDVFAAVEKLVRMGGNSKVGITLINQRSADLNKSVLELCANVFVHRQKGKNTILDLKKWFTLLDLTDDEQKKIADQLPNLKSGECWALLNDVPKPVFLKVPEKNSLHPDRRAKVSPEQAAKRKPVGVDAFVGEMKAFLTAEEEKKAAAEAEKAAKKFKGRSVKPVLPMGGDAAPPMAKDGKAGAKAAKIAAEAQARAVAQARAEGWARGWTAGHGVGLLVGLEAAKAAAIGAAKAVQAAAVNLSSDISAALKAQLHTCDHTIYMLCSDGRAVRGRG